MVDERMNNAGLGPKDRAMEIMPVIPAFSLAKAYISPAFCTLNHVVNQWLWQCLGHLH